MIKIKSLLLFPVVMALVACSSPTARYQWSSVPVGGGGYVTGVIFHPTEPNVLYARTDVGGAFRWLESEQSWLALNDATTREYRDDLGVLAIALDPTDPNKIYMMTGLYYQSWAPTGALLVSENRGTTWERIPLPFKVGGNENARGTGERLWVDPLKPSRLWAGSNHEGLWRSDDYGHTWENVETYPEKGVFFVHRFEPDAHESDQAGKVSQHWIVASDNPSSPLYRSDDGGETWKPFGSNFSDILFRRAASNTHALYIAGGNGEGPNGISEGAVWRYSFKTDSWKDISPPPGQGGFSGVSVTKSQSGKSVQKNRIIVSTFNRWHPHNEIFLSDNDGETWRPLLANGHMDTRESPYVDGHMPHWITDIALDPFNYKRAVFVTGYGVLFSNNIEANTVDWRFLSSGLDETVVLELISPPEGAYLYSVMGDLDGFKHRSLTNSSKAMRFQPELGSNNGIAYAANKPKMMVRTIERGEGVNAAWSNDGGDTWTLFDSEPTGAKGGSIALNTDGSVIVWSPNNAGVHASADFGRTWEKSRGIPEQVKPVADAVDPNTFYAYDPVGGVVYVSHDASQSYVPLNTLLPTLPDWQKSDGNLRAVPSKSGHFYVTTGQGLYRSTDGGASVSLLESVEASYLVAFGKSKTPKHYPAVYLWGKIDGVVGFYRSDDEGETWLKMNDDQHQYAHPRCMVGDSRVYGRLFIGTGGRGIVMADWVYD